MERIYTHRPGTDFLAKDVDTLELGSKLQAAKMRLLGLGCEVAANDFRGHIRRLRNGGKEDWARIAGQAAQVLNATDAQLRCACGRYVGPGAQPHYKTESPGCVGK